MYVLDYKLDKSLNGLRDELLSSYLDWLSQYYNSITENKRKLANKAISCFINNAYPKHNLGRDIVGLTLRESSYSKSLVVNGRDTKRKISYTYTRSFINYLVEVGYIDLYVGGQPEFQFIYGQWELLGHETSYATLLKKFKDLIDRYVKTEVDIKPITNVIILRNNKKQAIPFRMDDDLREIKNNLQEYNKFTLNYIVTCFLTVYDVQVYKIFNETFKSGGRSFMSQSIQSLSSEDRKHVKIEGEPVAIFDYKGFEPSILYTMCQVVYEGEDYYQLDTMKEYDPALLRKLVKVCMLIMFNSRSRAGAITSINKEIAAKFNTEDLYKKGKIPRRLIPVTVLVEQIELKHQPISKWFYVSYGEMLSNAGAYIADYVTSYMMQNYKTLAIPVFDEFIVQDKYRKELHDVMLEAFEAVLGFNDNCRLTEVC